jgi:hypothetical protein
MSTQVHTIVPFGELVAAAFDEAARYSKDPRQVSRLARRAVRHLLWRGRKTSASARRLRRLLKGRS